MVKNWRGVKSPDLEELGSLAEEIYRGLPDAFRRRCGNLVVQITDFPDGDVLRDFGDASPFDLMGLYQTAEEGGPDIVFLYRRPILDHWAESSDALDALLAHILIHEIGHHFGFSDEEMEAIERSQDSPAIRGAVAHGAAVRRESSS